MKNKKHHLVAKVQKSNRKIVETEAKKVVEAHIYMTPNTHIHDPSLSWLGTGTSINSGGVN